MIPCPEAKCRPYARLLGEPRQRHVFEHFARDRRVPADPRVILAPDQQILAAGRSRRRIGIDSPHHRKISAPRRVYTNGISAFSHHVRVSCSGEYETRPAPCLRRIGQRPRRRARQVHAVRVGEQQPLARGLRRARAKPRSSSPPSRRAIPSFRERAIAGNVKKAVELRRRSVGGLIVDDNDFFNFRLGGERFDRGRNRRFFVARGHDRGNSGMRIHWSIVSHPGNANLPIGVAQPANREIGVPRANRLARSRVKNVL